MTALLPMPPMGGGGAPPPSVSSVPPALASGYDPAQEVPGQGPLDMIQGILTTLMRTQDDLVAVAEAFPAAAPDIRAAIDSLRRASATVVGTAQTGSRQARFPIAA